MSDTPTPTGNPEDDDDYIPEKFTGPEGHDEQDPQEDDDG